MSNQQPESSRGIFHIAKLALSNVRLLHDIEQARKSSKEVHEIVSRRLKRDAVSEPISLLHQATFLQFGYICLVWLWENSKENNVNIGADELASKVGEEFDFGPAISRKVWERRVETEKEVLRLIRNSLSHGNVEAHDDFFVFEDKNRHSEMDYTSVCLTWAEFRELSEKVLFAINSSIYPDGEVSRPAEDPNA